MVGSDRRAEAAHFSLGKRYRTEQAKRCGHRCSHRLPEPRGPDPLRRRKLDNFRCRLQGRCAGQRGEGDHLRAGAGGCDRYRRCGNDPAAHFPAAGDQAGAASHQGNQPAEQYRQCPAPDAVSMPVLYRLSVHHAGGIRHRCADGLRRYCALPVGTADFLSVYSKTVL